MDCVYVFVAWKKVEVFGVENVFGVRGWKDKLLQGCVMGHSCNTPATLSLSVVTPSSPPRIIDKPYRLTLVFFMHFCPHLCILKKTFQSVTHPKIAPDQARLTPEFFAGGLSKKKVYFDGMSILSILLSLESGCHNSPLLED
jgi:hypothetical protein